MKKANQSKVVKLKWQSNTSSDYHLCVAIWQLAKKVFNAAGIAELQSQAKKNIYTLPGILEAVKYSGFNIPKEFLTENCRYVPPFKAKKWVFNKEVEVDCGNYYVADFEVSTGNYTFNIDKIFEFLNHHLKFIPAKERENLMNFAEFESDIDFVKECKEMEKYVGNDELRPNMMGVLFDFKNGVKIATVAHALKVAKIEKCDKESLLINPKNGVKKDGKFPLWEAVIPYQGAKIKLGAEFWEQLKSVPLSMLNQSTYQIRLNFSAAGDHNFVGEDIDFSNKMKVPFNCEYPYENDFSIGFNYQFLTKKIMMDKPEYMYVTQQNRAVVFTSENKDDVYLLMPVMLNYDSNCNFDCELFNHSDYVDIPQVLNLDSVAEYIEKKKKEDEEKQIEKVIRADKDYYYQQLNYKEFVIERDGGKSAVIYSDYTYSFNENTKGVSNSELCLLYWDIIEENFKIENEVVPELYEGTENKPQEADFTKNDIIVCKIDNPIVEPIKEGDSCINYSYYGNEKKATENYYFNLWNKGNKTVEKYYCDDENMKAVTCLYFGQRETDQKIDFYMGLIFDNMPEIESNVATFVDMVALVNQTALCLPLLVKKSKEKKITPKVENSVILENDIAMSKKIAAGGVTHGEIVDYLRGNDITKQITRREEILSYMIQLYSLDITEAKRVYKNHGWDCYKQVKNTKSQFGGQSWEYYKFCAAWIFEKEFGFVPTKEVPGTVTDIVESNIKPKEENNMPVDIDYKKLYEETKIELEKINEKISAIESKLTKRVRRTRSQMIADGEKNNTPTPFTIVMYDGTTITNKKVENNVCSTSGSSEATNTQEIQIECTCCYKMMFHDKNMLVEGRNDDIFTCEHCGKEYTRIELFEMYVSHLENKAELVEDLKF